MWAEDGPRPPPQIHPGLKQPIDPMVATVSTLQSLLSLRDELRNDIQKLNKAALSAESASQKQRLLSEVDKLNEDLTTTMSTLEEIAAGSNLASLRAAEERSDFNLTEELFPLLEPAHKEMREMTSHVRQKAEFKEKITYFRNRLPVTESAIANLEKLIAHNEGAALNSALDQMLQNWRKQDTFLRTELQSAQLQLDKLEASERTLAEASQGYLKEFFQNRGKILGKAMLVILAIAVLARLTRYLMTRFVPGFTNKNRTFEIRLVDLLHRILTGLLMVVGPMVIFYISEDWLLFSVGALILIGFALGLRQAIPRYWHQVQLFLNVGTVREGERLEWGGLPWLVKQINMYTMLENPTAGLVQRLKIDDLVDMRSRPLQKAEPWFPCRNGDWVLLEGNRRGKVVGLSQELVELVERGGAHHTYSVADFISLKPINLSVNFRIKESIGLSYDLQTTAVTDIPEMLRAHVEQRLTDEGYGDKLLNLRVEFELANESSLDLVMIADFKGELADLYNRLRRALQRYSVEACNLHGWEIPFTQVTLHQR